MTRNELKTVTVLAFCRVAVSHIEVNLKMHIAVNEALRLWDQTISKSNQLQMLEWLSGFEGALWKGKPQEAHTNLSFGIAILECQADFLKGRKANAVNQVIAIMMEIYDNLPKPEDSEHLCNDIAIDALEIWKKVVSL